MFGIKSDTTTTRKTQRIIGLTEKGYGLTCNSPYGVGIPLEQAKFEAIVNEIQELKRRVAELEAKLQNKDNRIEHGDIAIGVNGNEYKCIGRYIGNSPESIKSIAFSRHLERRVSELESKLLGDGK